MDNALQKMPKLLVVDDQAAVLSVTTRLLKADGYDVLQAISGSEGLRLFEIEQDGVDIVLADENMPGLTGIEFLKLVKEKFPDTVCLLYSGSADYEKVTEKVGQGVIDKFIPKGVEASEIRKRIRRALERGLREKPNGYKMV